MLERFCGWLGDLVVVLVIELDLCFVCVLGYICVYICELFRLGVVVVVVYLF